MSTTLATSAAGIRLKDKFGCDLDITEACLLVKNERLPELAESLKNTPGLDFDYLDMITAVDYPHGFELVYRFLSLGNNQLCLVKTSCPKNAPAVPSLAGLWPGSVFQEREIFDLFGIIFTGHPGLKRIVLWEGFSGHPLRKDFHYAP